MCWNEYLECIHEWKETKMPWIPNIGMLCSYVKRRVFSVSYLVFTKSLSFTCNCQLGRNNRFITVISGRFISLSEPFFYHRLGFLFWQIWGWHKKKIIMYKIETELILKFKLFQNQFCLLNSLYGLWFTPASTLVLVTLASKFSCLNIFIESFLVHRTLSNPDMWNWVY